DAGPDARLTGVSCVSATDCHAVGYRHTGDNWATLAERLSGSTWSVVASPTPAGATGNAVNAVSCSAANACMAVSDATQTTITAMRWTGNAWSRLNPSKPAGATNVLLAGVSCRSATSCDAVGTFVAGNSGNVFTLVDHWNGSTWTIMASPSPTSPTFNA